MKQYLKIYAGVLAFSGFGWLIFKFLGLIAPFLKYSFEHYPIESGICSFLFIVGLISFLIRECINDRLI